MAGKPQAEKAVERFPELGCFAVAVHNLSYLLDTPIAIRVREKRGKGLEG